MPIDVPTVLASAGISAVVGAVVSILTLSRITVGRMRAERAEQARLRIASEVRKQLLPVLAYNAGERNSGRRDPSSYHAQDAADAYEILHASEGLGRLRLRLLRSRCSRIYGEQFTKIAERFDPNGPDIGAMAFGKAIFANRQNGEQLVFSDGLLNTALRTDPGSAEMRRLIRQMRLLGHAR